MLYLDVYNATNRANPFIATYNYDYSELIEVEAATGSKRAMVAGILIGTARTPRIVQVDGQSIEANPEGVLLVVRNLDKPGIVGKLGMILGQGQVNIANMSLSRRTKEEPDLALTICELDDDLPPEVLTELLADPDIIKAKAVRFS